jgi:hypothetical protein
MPEDNKPRVATVAARQLHIVKIQLSPEQRVELEKLTGVKVEDLKIGVEDLVDLADLVAN